MENENSNQEQMNEESLAIREVIERVIQDEEFKNLLINDPDEALKEYNLSEMQTTLIKSLSEEDLSKLDPENLEELFAADAAVYTPDAGSEMDDDFFDDDEEL